MSNKPPILVVDEDEDIRNMISECLRRLGYPVSFAASGNEATDILAKAETLPGIIIMELTFLRGTSGLDTFTQIRETYPDIKVITMSGHEDTALTAEALLKGASCFIAKPFNIDTLERAIAISQSEGGE